MAEPTQAPPATPSAAAPLSPEQIARLQAIADAIPRDKTGQDAAKQLTWLVELLIQRGQLAAEHHAIVRRLKAEMAPAKVKLIVVTDKRAVPSPDVDCASLIHLCHARCCSMDVKLSAEDVREGKLRWRLDEPYLLERNEHGYCHHVLPNGGCGVYEERPAVCRSYDCRKDTRIWEDFDKKIPAAMAFDVVPLGEWNKPGE